MKVALIILVIAVIAVMAAWSGVLAQGENSPEVTTPEQVNEQSDEWRDANEELIREIAQETGRPLFEDLTFMSIQEQDCPRPASGPYIRCD
jgi:hypothetical protein